MSSIVVRDCVFCLAICLAVTHARHILVRDETFGTYNNPGIRESQNHSMIGRSFEAEDIKIGPFLKLHTGIPAESCPSISVQYQTILPKGDGTYRVPHSRILMNGKKCGTLGDNASEDELWVDDHMELMPVEFLANESISRKKGTNAAFMKLRRRRFPLAFYNFSLSERYQDPIGSNTWIGFERLSDRVCGNRLSGQVRLPQNALIIFGKNDDVRVKLTKLITRLTGGEFILEKFHPYQISFVNPPDGSDEHLCPLIFLERGRLEEEGEVRACFPATGTVQLSTGAVIPMRDLRVGDRVLDDSGGYSPVYMFSHRSSTARAEFVRLHTDNDHILTLSPGHYVHTPIGLATAAAIQMGDTVMTASGKALVKRTERTWARGLYNPHTISGNLVVDGVVASVYTSAVEPCVAHALLVPIRAIFWLAGARRTSREVLGTMFENGSNDLVANLVPRGNEIAFAAAVASAMAG